MKDIKVTVTGGELSEEEINKYKRRAIIKYSEKVVSGLNIVVDGEFVDITYLSEPVPFERIRRITGYLVGTLDKWNDGKKAEEKDRLKHG